jgi:hypothetical protein
MVFALDADIRNFLIILTVRPRDRSLSKVSKGANGSGFDTLYERATGLVNDF